MSQFNGNLGILRRQEAEGRGQRAKDRGQRAKGKGQRAKGRGQLRIRAQQSAKGLNAAAL